MISVIICSRTGQLDPLQHQNIADTVGTDYELVVIDNSGGRYGICAAYNEGVRRAKGDILHFRHDDLMHLQPGWGREVERIFADPTIGLLGVLGSHLLPDFPAYYCESPYLSGNNRDNDHGIIKGLCQGHWNQDGLAEVVAVDGQQFFIPRSLFPPLRFDEERLGGFHGYDMDISLQVIRLGKRVVVSNRIPGEHQWSDSKWGDRQMLRQLYQAMDIVYSKHHDLLPLFRGLDRPQTELDNLLLLWHDAYRYRKVLQSKAYRLGKTLLHPFK